VRRLKSAKITCDQRRDTAKTDSTTPIQRLRQKLNCYHLWTPLVTTQSRKQALYDKTFTPWHAIWRASNCHVNHQFI